MTKLNTGLSGCKLELVNGLLRKHSASVEYNSRLISQAEKQIVFSKRIYKNIETVSYTHLTLPTTLQV